MLQDIRDFSTGKISKIIIGVIILLLAFTGFEAIMSGTSNAQNAAKVNGEEITKNELLQATSMQRRQLAAQFGSDFDFSSVDDNLLREAALKGLIERKLLVQAATESDLGVTNDTLDQIIVRMPDFQDNGKFDANRFNMVLQQNGYGPMQFRQMLGQDMLIGQLRTGIAGSNFVTDEQIDRFIALENQTRDFSTLTVKADPAAIELSDQDIADYYEKNAARFMAPEQVKLEYIELTRDRFADKVTVDDEKLRPLYEAEVGNMSHEQRRASHILVEVGDKYDDEQARARIDEVVARLSAGEDFSALAKEYSDDPGSAAEGGDLGYAGEGIYDPAFESALYALKQEGEVSEPVKGDYGWHVIKLTGIRTPDVPSFESLKPKLTREYKEQQAEQLFVDAAKELDTLAYEASDLAEPAEAFGLTIKTSPLITRDGMQSGIFANRKVLQAAFSEDLVNMNSPVIEIDPNTLVVLRLKEHHDAEQLKLAEVSDAIRQRLALEKATAVAKTEGEKLIEQARAGQELAGWTRQEAITRMDQSIDPQILQQVFRMTKPAEDKPTFAGLSLANGDFQVLRLEGVAVQESAVTDDQRKLYRNVMSSRSGQDDFDAYSRYLLKEAKIERF